MKFLNFPLQRNAVSFSINDDTYGLRKVFPENADMLDSEEVAAADGGAEDIPHNRVVADIRRAVAEVVDNQQLQEHLRRPRCPAAVRHPHRILDNHSIAWKDTLLYEMHWQSKSKHPCASNALWSALIAPCINNKKERTMLCTRDINIWINSINFELYAIAARLLNL